MPRARCYSAVESVNCSQQVAVTLQDYLVMLNRTLQNRKSLQGMYYITYEITIQLSNV